MFNKFKSGNPNVLTEMHYRSKAICDSQSIAFFILFFSAIGACFAPLFKLILSVHFVDIVHFLLVLGLCALILSGIIAMCTDNFLIGILSAGSFIFFILAGSYVSGSIAVVASIAFCVILRDGNLALVVFLSIITAYTFITVHYFTTGSFGLTVVAPLFATGAAVGFALPHVVYKVNRKLEKVK